MTVITNHYQPLVKWGSADQHLVDLGGVEGDGHAGLGGGGTPFKKSIKTLAAFHML